MLLCRRTALPLVLLRPCLGRFFPAFLGRIALLLLRYDLQVRLGAVVLAILGAVLLREGEASLAGVLVPLLLLLGNIREGGTTPDGVVIPLLLFLDNYFRASLVGRCAPFNLFIVVAEPLPHGSPRPLSLSPCRIFPVFPSTFILTRPTGLAVDALPRPRLPW